MHRGTARIHYLLIYQTSKLRWALQLVTASTHENFIFPSCQHYVFEAHLFLSLHNIVKIKKI